MVTSTITGIFYTPDGEKIYQRHSNLGEPVTLKAVSETGTEDEITVKPCTSTGLDVSVTYETVTDPFDPNHLLTACTDFGLIQSFDGGKSWTRSLRQWNVDGTENAYMAYYLRNTCYNWSSIRSARAWYTRCGRASITCPYPPLRVGTTI